MESNIERINISPNPSPVRNDTNILLQRSVTPNSSLCLYNQRTVVVVSNSS